MKRWLVIPPYHSPLTPEISVRTMILVICLMLLGTTSLEAQRNCVKGKPCGNSCIAASKTCRIGTPSSTPTTSTPQRTAARLRADSVAASERTRAALAAMKNSVDSAKRQPILDPTQSAFVGDASRKIFFRRGCAAASRIAEDNSVVFVSEDDAKVAGYARSGAAGC